ncbi:MAG: hypothetical protein EBZ36_09275, partial [Acidobacteria bacterium]|nr:hypothetical protein [Acidobacteriota bacterium]
MPPKPPPRKSAGPPKKVTLTGKVEEVPIPAREELLAAPDEPSGFVNPKGEDTASAPLPGDGASEEETAEPESTDAPAGATGVSGVTQVDLEPSSPSEDEDYRRPKGSTEPASSDAGVAPEPVPLEASADAEPAPSVTESVAEEGEPIQAPVETSPVSAKEPNPFEEIGRSLAWSTPEEVSARRAAGEPRRQRARDYAELQKEQAAAAQALYEKEQERKRSDIRGGPVLTLPGSGTGRTTEEKQRDLEKFIAENPPRGRATGRAPSAQASKAFDDVDEGWIQFQKERDQERVRKGEISQLQADKEHLERQLELMKTRIRRQEAQEKGSGKGRGQSLGRTDMPSRSTRRTPSPPPRSRAPSKGERITAGGRYTGDFTGTKTPAQTKEEEEYERERLRRERAIEARIAVEAEERRRRERQDPVHLELLAHFAAEKAVPKPSTIPRATSPAVAGPESLAVPAPRWSRIAASGVYAAERPPLPVPKAAQAVPVFGLPPGPPPAGPPDIPAPGSDYEEEEEEEEEEPAAGATAAPSSLPAFLAAATAARRAAQAHQAKETETRPPVSAAVALVVEEEGRRIRAEETRKAREDEPKIRAGEAAKAATAASTTGKAAARTPTPAPVKLKPAITPKVPPANIDAQS